MASRLKKRTAGEEEEARIEVVPLIDIMFFLLASFMLVSLSMTQVHRVDVELPTASSGRADNQIPPVHLALDAHGVISWDAEIVTASEITRRLLVSPGYDTHVLIAADKDCPHQHVLVALDAVRAGKVTKVGFETRVPNP